MAIPGVSGMLGVEEARVILVSEHRAARQTSKHRVSVAGFSQVGHRPPSSSSAWETKAQKAGESLGGTVPGNQAGSQRSWLLTPCFSL